jgi:hypothetical protein
MLKSTRITAEDMKKLLVYLQNGGFNRLLGRIETIINERGPKYMLCDDTPCCPQWP